MAYWPRPDLDVVVERARADRRTLAELHQPCFRLPSCLDFILILTNGKKTTAVSFSTERTE